MKYELSGSSQAERTGLSLNLRDPVLSLALQCLTQQICKKPLPCAVISTSQLLEKFTLGN